MTDKTKIPSKLSAFLAARGSSIRWLADATALNYYRVYKITHGARPRAWEAVKIAQALECATSEVFDADAIIGELAQ